MLAESRLRFHMLFPAAIDESTGKVQRIISVVHVSESNTAHDVNSTICSKFGL